MVKHKEHILFGGDKSWTASDWTASDDRVRGGKSQSHLEISGSTARFHGHLDIEALGGAGFASQRTIAADSAWDVSHYDGILLHLGKSDGKRYTFILKDGLLPRNSDNGREQATISWEYDFVITDNAAQTGSSFVYIPWKSLKPTYRGKEKKGVKEIDTKHIKRFSLMMRSFFGDQQGDFSLSVKSIKAVSRSNDLEKCPTENGKKATLRSPLLLSLLATTVLAYGLCAYVCPWVMNAHTMKHWGWR